MIDRTMRRTLLVIVALGSLACGANPASGLTTGTPTAKQVVFKLSESA
jgi:hypothetical protein